MIGDVSDPPYHGLFFMMNLHDYLLPHNIQSQFLHASQGGISRGQFICTNPCRKYHQSPLRCSERYCFSIVNLPGYVNWPLELQLTLLIMQVASNM